MVNCNSHSSVELGLLLGSPGFCVLAGSASAPGFCPSSLRLGHAVPTQCPLFVQEPIVPDVPQFSKAVLTCPKHCCCEIYRTAHPTPEVHLDFRRPSACWFCISPFFHWPLPFLYYLSCPHPLFKCLILSLLLLRVLLRLIKPAINQ